MNMNKNKSNRFMPFIMALCVVIGIIIGTFFSKLKNLLSNEFFCFHIFHLSL